MDKQQPYIYNARVDWLFICSPPFLCLLAVLLFPGVFNSSGEISEWWWVLLVIGVDVTHVYTTLYKTYFSPRAFELHKVVLTLVPLLCFIGAFLLYSFGARVFWGVLAYVAVFHFIRQQYGFMRIYSRREAKSLHSRIDALAVYSAMLYPMIYWHVYGPFEFDWFIKNDFVFLRVPFIEQLAAILYVFILVLWVGKELLVLTWYKKFNLPRFAIIAGTYTGWYFGIVYYHADLSFTLFNVICHGIPYIALVWMDAQKNQMVRPPEAVGYLQRLSLRYFVVFISIPLLLAYVEEFGWNLLVWSEKKDIFGMPNGAVYSISEDWKKIVIPLLVLPQLTHYVIDGFIWKVSKGHIRVSE